MESRPAQRRMHYVLAAVLLLLAVTLALTLSLGGRPGPPGTAGTLPLPDAEPNSLAVLPFTNAGGSPADQALVDGLYTDVRDRIALIAALRVTSRNSAMAYRGAASVPPSIQTDLGVATVLTGSVLRNGESVRLDVELVDARTLATLWAESYQRNLTAADLFAVQSDIAHAVAAALNVPTTSAEKKRIDHVPTESFPAYETFWLGRQYLRSRDTDGLGAAADYMLEAIGIDPEYSSAYFGLATAYLAISRFARVVEQENPEIRAQLALERGLAIDDGQAAGWVALALLEESSGENADDTCRRALELAPNDADIIHQCGRVLTLEPEEHSELYARAWRLDPLSPAANWYFALALEQAGRFDEAIALFERTVQFAPGFPNAYWGIGHIYFYALGEAEPAYRWYRDAARLGSAMPEPPAALGRLYAELGLLDDAQQSVDRALRLGSAAWWPNFSAEQLELARGDIYSASRYSEQVLREIPTAWRSLNVLRNLDLQGGRPEAALQRYRRVLPELFAGDDPRVDDDNFIAAVDASFVLLETGDVELATRLLHMSLEHMQDKPRGGLQGFGFADVKAYALLGRPDDAIAALERAIDENYWAGWRQLESDPAFAAIREDRGFRAALDEIREIVDDQRDTVQELLDEEPAAER